jgi:type I restriction enzyme S subunit
MKAIALAEVCEIVMGQAPKGDTYNDAGEGLPLIAGAGDFGEVFPRPKKFTTARGVRVSRPADVIVGIRASIGDKVWSDGVYCLGRGVAALRSGPRLDQRYLWNWMSHAAPSLAAKGRGATFLQVNKQDLAEMEIPLPPIEEQRRLAAVLDAADALRAKRRQALAKLDTLTQAIFIDMFGDPVENEREWQSSALEDVTQGIFDCPHSTPKWTDDGLVCLRTSNLGKGVWDWTDTRYVSRATFDDRSKRAYLEPDDIVVSREGTVGIAAIVEADMLVCMGQRLVQVRPDRDIVRPRFLLDVLLFLLAPERIGRVMAGSTAKHLNVRDLKALEVITPPARIQDQYVAALGGVIGSRAGMSESGQRLDALYDALQQSAFRGDL